MIRRLGLVIAALSLLVACSGGSSKATYKRPTPKSTTTSTTTPVNLQQQVLETTDCKVLLGLWAQEGAKVPPPGPPGASSSSTHDNAAVTQAKRNLIYIYLRQVALNCPAPQKPAG